MDVNMARNSLSPSCTWNIVQFGLVCSFTMSFSAIWKFPYYIFCHSGLFLVAYYILLVLIAIPVTFLQLKLGSILQQGILRIFSHYIPAIQGVAVAVLLIAYIQSIYNGSYLSQLLYFALASMKHPYTWSLYSNTTSDRISSSYIFFAANPAEHYYYNDVLHISDSIKNTGMVPWYLGLVSLLTWFIVFALIAKGPKCFGKLIYGTSLSALSLLLIILIYTHVAIPDAHKSLQHFFSNEEVGAQFGIIMQSKAKHKGGILSSQIASPLTWIHALEQHIYCLALWFGVLPTLGSYLGNRKPASNLSWVMLLVIHSILPHLATIAFVPLLHALAVHKQIPLKDIVRDGPDLLFVVIPEALSSCKVNNFMAFLIFICLFLFTLHYQALILLVIVENMIESKPYCIKIIFRRRELLTAALCGLAYLLGLSLLTQAGSYLAKLLDLYLFRSLCILILLYIPPFVLAYAKIETFHLPIERLCMCLWFGFASLATCALLICNIVDFQIPYASQLNKLTFPSWSHCIGWNIAIWPAILCVASGFGLALYNRKGALIQRFLAVWNESQTDSQRNIENVPDQDSYLMSGDGGGTLKFRKKAVKQIDPEKRKIDLQISTETVLSTNTENKTDDQYCNGITIATSNEICGSETEPLMQSLDISQGHAAMGSENKVYGSFPNGQSVQNGILSTVNGKQHIKTSADHTQVLAQADDFNVLASDSSEKSNMEPNPSAKCSNNKIDVRVDPQTITSQSAILLSDKRDNNQNGQCDENLVERTKENKSDESDSDQELEEHPQNSSENVKDLEICIKPPGKGKVVHL